ncbi:hypothetical protein [Geodermatophilus sp. SYSU D00696]
MRPTWRDALATLLVAAAVLAYVAHLVGDDLPLLRDPRGTGAVVLVLGVAAALVPGRAVRRSRTNNRVALTTGAAGLVLGIATVWVGTSEELLWSTVAFPVVTWGLGEVAALDAWPPTRRQTPAAR